MNRLGLESRYTAVCPSTPDEKGISLLGGVLLVRADFHVLEVNGIEADIPLLPHALLYEIGRTPNEVVSFSEILECIWGESLSQDPEYAEMQVRKIHGIVKGLRTNLGINLGQIFGDKPGHKLVISQPKRGIEFDNNAFNA